MRARLIIGYLLIVGLIYVCFTVSRVVATCDSGIRKEHLDSTPGNFVDNDTIEIDATNGLQIKDAGVTVDKMSAGACWRHSGTSVFNGEALETYNDLDLSPIVGSNHALVFLKITPIGAANHYFVKTKGENGDPGLTYANAGGCALGDLPDGGCGYFLAETDAAGKLEWRCGSGEKTTQIWLMGYIK